MQPSLQAIFPVCSTLLPRQFWHEQGHAGNHGQGPENFPTLLETYLIGTGAAGYLPDLARVELALYRLRKRPVAVPAGADHYQVNPRLELVEVDWHPLLPLLDGNQVTPVRSKQWLVFWNHPRSGRERQAVATTAELLALKVIAEQLDPMDVATETGQPVGIIDAAIERAGQRGLLVAPASTLQRQASGVPIPAGTPEEFLAAEVFTLQWHITHRCDLHCRHCYDRSLRNDVSLEQGLRILDQLRSFCLNHHVGGQVSFSGGNPFLHPDFTDLYRAARDRNLNLAILGNPVSEQQLDEILQIAKPAFYQVSLEGLQPHNDHIRGSGSFDAVLEFLDLLRRKQVYSMVMLTLTRANLDQVLPLAEILRDRVDLFTYNRLSMVGEGAFLESPGPDEYRKFVSAYLAARRNNPIMALKDSLLNIELEHHKQGIFGGCTGYGCGAAFNFVSLLPDGQVHACRKFPSPIGDINLLSLAEIYESWHAKAYRRGCTACDDCHLRAVCGGCLAVAYGFGMDPLRVKDPACFLSKDPRANQPS
jgi:selenobiotic family peptide radical SAM maturase